MIRRLAALLFLLALTAPLAAQKKEPAGKGAKQADPPARTGTVKVDGKNIDFTVTAGKMEVKNDDGKTLANIFHIIYRRKNTNLAKRPITFCYNGGPGSSSVWLHLGMLGPKRIKFPDDAKTLKPPYRLESNPHSLLDVTDLVFIDPVSTGFSRPAKGEKKSQFHGYSEDIRSVSQFVHDYLSKHNRWKSPKFLLGESYGGMRAAGMSGYLRQRYNIELNGVVLVSAAMNFQTLRFSTSNDLPFVLFVPSFAATAWYHKALPKDLQRLPLATVVKRAERFALGTYATALLRGTSLSAKERNAVATELARLTGLKRDYVLRSNLRVSMSRFGKELLRHRGQTIGRFDSRYTGQDRDGAGSRYEFDASGAAIFGPFTATINEYLRSVLKVKDHRVYEILTGNVFPWNYKNFANRYVDSSESLRQAMAANEHLKVFIACGYYDLATPPFSMQYTVNHLGLKPERLKNITTRFYEGGHMMYIHEPSMVKLRRDLLKFYDSSR